MRVRAMAGVMALAVVAASCGAGGGGSVSVEIDATDDGAPAVTAAMDEDLVRGAAATWLNNLGMGEIDVGLWRGRLERACGDGVWIEDVGQRLAAEFMAADSATSVRVESLDPPTVFEGAYTLWIAAAQVCGEDFPPEARAAGPPSPVAPRSG